MVDLPKPEFFFPELEKFSHREIFNGVERPWDVLPKIRNYIHGFLSSQKPTDVIPAGLKLMEADGCESALFCETPICLKDDYFCRELGIFIGVGTKMEPTAIIKGSTIIGRECDIRHGAYLRGDLITGDKCTLGHTTEIKSSIIMNHSEMGHFNYIGDTVIGSFVNIGAGTKFANLKFRSVETKQNTEFPEIIFEQDGENVSTGISKFGAIVGDYCETGCNSVLLPATIMAPECWVYPNFTVPSGYHAKGKLLR